MGLLDRLLGRPERGAQAPESRQPAPPPAADGDEAAIERYRYLLRTAPPDKIEQAHAEAFAQLTPDQRRQVLDGLSREVPESERTQSDDPQSLARMATRAEMRNPGTLERSFGRGGAMGGGMGMGGMIAGSLLASVAGAFIGTAIATELMDGDGGASADAGGGDTGGDPGADAGGDAGGGDAGGGDVAAGDFGGDIGGGFGDFGGGDFGGI